MEVELVPSFSVFKYAQNVYMDDLRYLEDEEKFLNYSFDVFKKYFNNDREAFNLFYKSIESGGKKNKFLKISSLYKFLVVEGKFTIESDKSNTYIDYLDHTHKYIAIFSFIEDLYTVEEHKEFYSWLNSSEANIEFPIKDKAELDKLHKSYLSIHGSTQKAVRFFESLDDNVQKYITDNFQVINNVEKSVTYLARLLYQIRSDFVHKSKITAQFNEGITMHSIGNKRIRNSLDFEKVKMIFENGFLRFFGFVSSPTQIV